MSASLPDTRPVAAGTLFLVGPTAVGKTEASLWLARKIDAEIVYADSMSVYRGMDIATAKPTAEQQAEVPHHMIDVIEVSEPFSVGEYRKLALRAIEDIRRRGKVALVCGGTGLYVRSLLDGLFEGPAADWELRKKLLDEAERKGPGALHAELSRIDPEAGRRILPNDVRRLIRALEVHYRTGRPISCLQVQWQRRQPALAILGLTMHRHALYSRIDQRVEEMFQRGLVEETTRLLEKGLRQNRTAIQAIGYKEVLGFLDGLYSLDQAKTVSKRNSRRYAKRQLTWFRKDDRIKWHIVDDYESRQKLYEALLESLVGIIQKTLPGSNLHPQKGT